MEALIKEYLNYLEIEKSLSPNTIRRYSLCIKIFHQFLFNTYPQVNKFSDITKAIILDFLKYTKEKRNNGPRGINQYLVALKSYCKWLVSYKYINISPAEEISQIKQLRSLPRALSMPQVNEVVQAPFIRTGIHEETKIRDAAMFELLYATGIRVSELINLKLADLDLVHDVARIKGKRQKERIVLLNPLAREKILKYLHYRAIHFPVSIDPAVFLTKRRKRFTLSGFEVMWNRYRQALRLPKHITPHTIRHSFATHLLEGNADLMTIKELLGHESLQSTQIYTRVTVGRLWEVYRKAHPNGR